MDFDLDRDLVMWRPPEPEYMDKFPDMLPHFPVELKCDIHRRLLREGWPLDTLIQVTATRGSNSVQITFNPPGVADDNTHLATHLLYWRCGKGWNWPENKLSEAIKAWKNPIAILNCYKADLSAAGEEFVDNCYNSYRKKSTGGERGSA